MMAEVKILKYGNDSVEEACHLLIEDWKSGKIEWEYEETNKVFNRDWLEKYGTDPISQDYTPQYENGVRVLEWYCSSGPKEGNDEIVLGYFLHTIH